MKTMGLGWLYNQSVLIIWVSSCDLEHSFLVKESLNQDSSKEIATFVAPKEEESDGRNAYMYFLKKINFCYSSDFF
jgi:hypothetical protein